MNENRENLLQGLYAVKNELQQVLNYEQTLQNLSSQLRAERNLIHSTTVRAKFNQVLAAFCVAAVGLCAAEGLLKFRFDQAALFALLTVLVYKFFKPERYQDKKLNVFRIGLSLLCIWLVCFFAENIWNFMDGASVWKIIYMTIFGVVFAIIAVVSYRLLSKKRQAANEEISVANEATRARNQQLRNQYAAAQDQLNQHSQEVQRLCAGWFPMDYCSLYAIDCFIRYVENYQADTVKEMVNQFEDSEYKRRMEEAQRQTQRQIQFMTLTNIMNAWSVQDTMNRNARNIQNTMNQNADSINRTINNAADRIRRGW